MSLVVFLFIHIIPGDAADAILGMDNTPENRAALRAELGLDKNIFVQYMIWIGKLFTGDLGKSVITHKPVLDTIIDKAGATIILTIAAMFIATFISIMAGCLAAINKGTWKDFGILFMSLVGVSIPSFWLGILLMLAFSLHWPIFPAIGYASIFEDFGSAIRHLILPAVTLGTVTTGAVARMARSEMIEQLSRDYVITAWAKGLSPRGVYFKHALRNSLITVVTFIGLQFAWMLGGVVIVEIIFTWPGLGTLVMESILRRDYPMVQGVILFISLTYVLINLLVDVSYTYLDPQIRLGRKG